MQIRTIIAASSLFEGLPSLEIDDIAAIAIEKSYQRGESIFFEGDAAAGFYMVAVGRVKIFKMSPGGKEHILHIFGAGEPFGEVPVFHGRPFPASAEAMEKSVTMYFPRDRFIRLVEKTPSIALNMLGVLSLRLRRFAAQIENLSLKEVPARLADYLLYLSAEQGDVATVELPITKGQLASLLGTIPETLSRIFARMSDDRLIAVNGRRITLLDREGLGDY